MPSRPREETSLGSLAGLKDLRIPPNAVRDAEKRLAWLKGQETATSFRVTGCIAGMFEEPREFDRMVGLRESEPLVRSNAEIQEFRRQRGFRFARETVALGDVHGYRGVVHCDAEQNVRESTVQPEVPVHLFQSPEIPAWRSRVVSTEDTGSDTVRKRAREGLETVRAILAEPSHELLLMLLGRKWTPFARENGATEENAGALSQRLYDEIHARLREELGFRLGVIQELGADLFASIWNAAISPAVYRETAPDSPPDAPEETVARTDPAAAP